MSSNATDDKDVSKDDLVQRINEQLTTDSRSLQELRMEESPSFGNYYAGTNEIAERPGDIDIESIGRELGVLGHNETYTENAVTEPESE